MNELAYKISLGAMVVAMNFIRLHYQRRYKITHTVKILNRVKILNIGTLNNSRNINNKKQYYE
jgi:hypothetical protein